MIEVPSCDEVTVDLSGECRSRVAALEGKAGCLLDGVVEVVVGRMRDTERAGVTRAAASPRPFPLHVGTKHKLGDFALTRPKTFKISFARFEKNLSKSLQIRNAHFVGHSRPERDAVAAALELPSHGQESGGYARLTGVGVLSHTASLHFKMPTASVPDRVTGKEKTFSSSLPPSLLLSSSSLIYSSSARALDGTCIDK